MACPTCDHTMQLLTANSNRAVFVCPRCGTLIERKNGQDETAPILVPTLVQLAADLLEVADDCIQGDLHAGRLESVREAVTR